MKKIFVLLLLMAFAFVAIGLESDAKKSKKGGIAEEELTQMGTTIDNLTKKMYARGLFSPQDCSNLIGIKLKLDDQMLLSPDVTLAPYYYKLAVLFKARGMKDESVECFQTILENFGTTALAPKAMAQLKLMGVAVSTIGTPQDGMNAGK